MARTTGPTPSSPHRDEPDRDGPDGARARWSGPYRLPLGLFVAAALVVFLGSHLSMALIAYTEIPHSWRDGFFGTFGRYDSAWYLQIATGGYFYDGPGRQSAVAFFPAYPAAMRVVALVVRDALVAGVLVTLACGAGVAVTFWRWCRGAFGDERTADFAVAALLLYPFAFFLYGAVYSDALFILAAILAFTLLEHERPLLAGIVGALATAARPVGVALAVGLVVRELEIRGVLAPSRPAFFGRGRAADDGPPLDVRDASERVPLVPRRLDLRRLRISSAGVLLSGLGLAAYCAFLWWRFGEPLAFEKVASSAPGWSRQVDLRTILHVLYFQLLQSYGLNVITFWLTMQGLFSLVSLLSVVAVARRIGRGYAVYVLLAVGLAFASQAQFIGMGRYVLAAFPTFALVGRFLARPRAHNRRWVPAAAFGVSSILLLWMASLYARWVFLA